METAKNSLSTSKKETSIDSKPQKGKTVLDVIKSMKSQFEIALPKHINSERFVRVAITTIRQNPNLAKCKQESLLGALMVSAQLGLEPGILGQAYIIPYGVEAQFQIGYKGMIELLRRSGQLKDIYAYSVYENDEFNIEYGLERKLIHKPNFENRGKVIGYYSVAILKDDTKAFNYMTLQEIEKHRDRFSKASKSNSSPWKTDFDSMALKTVIKLMLKYLPISVEWLEKSEKDEKVYNLNTTKPIDEVTVLDENLEEVTEDISEAEIIEEKSENKEDLYDTIFNHDTGEVIENA